MRRPSPSLIDPHATAEGAAATPLVDASGRRAWLGAQAGRAGATLATSLAWVSLAAPARAERRPPPRADSPHLGVDPIFVQTGLATRWQAAMGRDLGWQARWTPMDSPEVLRQLESGEVHAGLFLNHPRADELDRAGLIHSRQTIATTEVLLVGPTDDLAGLRSESDTGRALNQVMLAAQAGAANWVPPRSGTSLDALLAQLTRGQGMDPRGLRAAAHPPAKGLAYELVTRAQWRPQDRRKVWLQGDDRLRLAAQVACSFRVRHPGAKLLVNWLGWPLAQSAFKAGGAAWQGVPGPSSGARR